MNAEDADRSRPGRGSAHRGRTSLGVYDELLGGWGEVCSRNWLPQRAPAAGSRSPHAFRPRRTRLPLAAPNASGPAAGSPTPPRSDPRVSACIRGSSAVAVVCGHPRPIRRARVNPRPLAVAGRGHPFALAHVGGWRVVVIRGPARYFHVQYATCRGTEAHPRRTIEEGV